MRELVIGAWVPSTQVSLGSSRPRWNFTPSRSPDHARSRPAPCRRRAGACRPPGTPSTNTCSQRCLRAGKARQLRSRLHLLLKPKGCSNSARNCVAPNNSSIPVDFPQNLRGTPAPIERDEFWGPGPPNKSQPDLTNIKQTLANSVVVW
jgi:hypothetical protein